MRSIAQGLAVALTLAMLVTLAVAQPTEGESTTAPPGTVIVHENVLMTLMDEPEKHFEQARREFQKHELKPAGVEVRKGAAFLRVESGRGDTVSKEALLKSAGELEKLGDEMEKGTVNTVAPLNQGFARADLALAEHYHALAEQAKSEKDSVRTGRALEGAAYYVEKSAAWSGHRLEAGGSTAVRGAHTLADKLKNGAAWTGEEIGKALSAVGDETTKLAGSLGAAAK